MPYKVKLYGKYRSDIIKSVFHMIRMPPEFGRADNP